MNSNAIKDELLNKSYSGITTTHNHFTTPKHLAQGAPKNHAHSFHYKKINKGSSGAKISILRKETDFNRLQIMEAIFIKMKTITLNNQSTGRTRVLKLGGR